MGGGAGGHFSGTRGSEETTTTENSMPTKSKHSKMKKVDKLFLNVCMIMREEQRRT